MYKVHTVHDRQRTILFESSSEPSAMGELII